MDTTTKIEIPKPEPLLTDAQLHEKRYGGRTQQQILSREPVVVTLGGVEYSIRPAVISVARMFSEKLAAMMRTAFEAQSITTDDSAQFFEALQKLLDPAQMLDLLCAYASEPVPGQRGTFATYLPTEAIEDSATVGELALAFKGVMELNQSPLVDILSA